METPSDGLQICPKHVEVDCTNKLRINSASSWFSVHGYIDMHGQQNTKSKKVAQKIKYRSTHRIYQNKL